MTRELPPELRDLSDEEKEQRRQRLIEESAETRRELEAEQEDLLQSLDEEHGGDLVQTKVTLPGENLATVETVVNGELMNRMSHVDSLLERLDDPEPGDMKSIERSMDTVAGILADITAEPKYSKELFYEVYLRYGPDALGEHAETAFEAIEQEIKRRAGDVKGFREKP